MFVDWGKKLQKIAKNKSKYVYLNLWFLKLFDLFFIFGKFGKEKKAKKSLIGQNFRVFMGGGTAKFANIRNYRKVKKHSLDICTYLDGFSNFLKVFVPFFLLLSKKEQIGDFFEIQF